MLITPYSQQDFQQHPEKYKLFKTARIAQEIHSLPDLQVGQMVRIRYFDAKINTYRGSVRMPIFQVWTDNDMDLKACPAMLYAVALGDFAL